MGGLSSVAVRHPKVVLSFLAVVVLASALGAARLRQEDDLLAFLPQHDPDVRRFAEVSRRFGGLRVGLVGIETARGEDVFAPATLTRLRAATEAIHNLQGIDRVLSLTTVTDPSVSDEGADLRPLIPSLPTSPAEAKALRERVLSRRHVAGSLVSTDGRAALIMAFFADGASDRILCAEIRRVAAATLAPLTIYYGGAPFAGRAIYEEAQEDIWWLSPVAVLVLLLVVVFSFRDLVGVLLTVLSVAIATLLVLGAMGWAGESFNAATSTLPVILFASGSSYAVHVLGRYYLERARAPSGRAVQQALTIVGAPVAIAAGTTAVGFISFVFTDVRPMRVFGIACGGGVIACWLVSLTLVPAVLTLWPRRAREGHKLVLLGEAMVALWGAARRRRAWVLALAVAVGVCALKPMRRVAVRMDPRAFFRPGSEPARADEFLDQRFGGSTFVQVALHGDFTDPATLRELSRLGDFARALPSVTQVQSIVQPLALVDEVMGNGLRLPSTREQAANLFFFLDGETGMRALITPDRRDALLHVRVRGDAEPVVAALEHFAESGLHRWPEAPTHDDVVERVGFIAAAAARPAPPYRVARALSQVALPSDDDPAWQNERAQLAADESFALLPAEAQDKRLADARRELAAKLALPSLMTRLNLSPDDAPRLMLALDDLVREREPGLRAPVELSAEVAGEPVLARGFSRSVARNLDVSMAIALVLVLALLYALFRSLRAALICLFPSLLTLGILFAAMGLWGVTIDLGTSLVASIATGAGSDFAMHYYWYLRRDQPDNVSRSVGPIMTVSIILVSLGFFVLALGRSPVMHLLGTLAGLSMTLAALLTCLVLPALYSPSETSVD
jgi:predicted RND superfamily exporter protein